MRLRSRLAIFAAAALACAGLAHAQVVSVDAGANPRPIDPRIYGIHFGGTAALGDLNASINRYGGNSSGRYNWQQNVDNRGGDYFFESIPYPSANPGELGDTFIGATKAGGAEPFLTIPMVDWIAKTDAFRNTLWSFSVNLYGAQCAADGDAGNGLLPNPTCATPIHLLGNNPNDASTLNSSAIQQGWFQHVVDTWGPASTTGLKYWGYDNEPSIWFNAYWDVVPTGKHDTEMRDKMFDYGAVLRAVDPGVTILGPEEWGWDAIFYSGFDQQANAACGFCGNTPDHDARGDYVAYLLDQLQQYEINNGTRLLDVVSIHFYPQGTEYYPDSNASDPPTQLLRNRSTRGLWDPNYLNESYINDYVQLIPRMKTLTSAHYPGLKVGLTEYNWGGDFIMNGATVQADILGILGREGADMAIRWDTNGFTPAMPPYHGFKMYRNYDGNKSTFGDTSVLAAVPDPDTVAAFAATRSSDGALTIMVVNKSLAGSPPAAVTVNIAGFTPGPSAQVWQLAGTGTSIAQLANVPVAGNALSATLPSPSVTLFVVPAASVPLPSLSIAGTTVSEAAGTAFFVVTADAAAPAPVTVSYATADGTAAAGFDYVGATGTVTIPQGSQTVTIPVAINDDALDEPDESFTVTLTGASGGTISGATASGVIQDDDGGTLFLPEITPGLELRRDFVLSSEEIYRLTQQRRSSYEVVVDALSGDLTPLSLDRLGPDYSVLSSSVPAGSGFSRSLRLENAGPSPVSTELVRVRSGGCVNNCTTNETYRLRLYDTTYRAARFNNSASQITVLALRNEGDSAVSGNVWAWGVNGVLAGSQAFTIPAHGSFSLNTSTVAPGGSGSLTVSSDGAYGQLWGKAVSVEPATGFTFDTLLEPRPR